jgi:hypothetical protein
MSTTPQFEIPTDLRKMTEQSMEQVKTAINGYLQFFQRAIPGNVMGGNELSNKVLNYAERNVATAFEFAQRLVQVRDVQSLARLQMEFIQAQMQALTEQAKDLSETTTKAMMDTAKTRQRAACRRNCWRQSAAPPVVARSRITILTMISYYGGFPPHPRILVVLRRTGR